MSTIRCIRADNASPLTLAGTQTYIVGEKQVAIIDPGPLLHEHLDAVAEAVGSGVPASVLITHRHPDHAAGAQALAERLGTSVTRSAADAIIETDGGPLRAIATPGHTPDHLAFFLERERAVFCGDLMMGGLDTALVALPEGNLQSYLDSLQRLRALQPAVIYPAHGPPFDAPAAAIDRYVQHRMERVEQVTHALRSGPRTVHQLVADIYGPQLEAGLRAYAGSAVEAYLAYLEANGQVRAAGQQWSRV